MQMFKRLSIVAINTGLSQLIALIAIGFATRTFDADTIGRIGTIESSILLITSIISFGLQLSTNRNIVINKNWERYFEKGQKARLAMSILLLPVGMVYWLTGDIAYLLFFASPIIALNGDYALYGRSMPEYASRVSFYRVLIPSIALITCSILHLKIIVSCYSFALAIGILIAGYLSSLALRTCYFFLPEIKSLKYYLSSIKIGIATVSLTVMSSGIILVSNYFYRPYEVGEAYLGIKLFIIYKGVRRIIIQAFFSELNESINALIVDRLNIMIGILGGGIFIFYPIIIINIFYGNTSESLVTIIQLVGVSILFSSMTSAAGAVMLLKKMDNAYFLTCLSSMLVAILTLICASFILPDSMGILIGVIIGELLLLVFFIFFLGYRDFFSERIKIFLINSFILLIPPVCINIIENKIIGMVLSLIIMLILLILINKSIIKGTEKWRHSEN